LNSDAWFFLFVILDRLSLQAIHLDKWSEIPRPPRSSPALRAAPAPMAIVMGKTDRGCAPPAIHGADRDGRGGGDARHLGG
jgi:hypothetical protein